MKELRIGVVLYGGVSLAVYMNGITTELWHAIRASKIKTGLGGTAKIYRALLDEAAQGDNAEIRIVVDTIAGSSAGGVNGVVLGHAIAHGSNAAVLNEVWINDAGIEQLRRSLGESGPRWKRVMLWPLLWLLQLLDWGLRLVLTPFYWVTRKWTDVLSPTKWSRAIWMLGAMLVMLLSGNGRATPLSGAYFSRMIAASLARMRQQGSTLLDPHHVLDLYLTQTDLFGWPRHLPVSTTYHPKALDERTHAHCLHFRAGRGRADFDDEFALTYAARTTAGFPIAFPPANISDLKQAFRAGQPDAAEPDAADFSRRHLSEHVLREFDPDNAWMADGGFLDNRPFTYVAEAIEGKVAEHEVTRAVIYVEPDPEAAVDKPPKSPPGMLALAGRIYGLFRHEPILEDLMRLTRRNAKVQRIKDMLSAELERAEAVVRELGQNLLPADTPLPVLAHLEGWTQAVDDYLASRAQSGYAGYRQLRARRAAEMLADVICRALGYRWETRQAYMVRETVRRMLADALKAPKYVAASDAADSRSGAYAMAPLQGDLLDAFDFGFRIRRLRHIVRAVNGLYSELVESPQLQALRPILDEIKAALADVAEHYERTISDDAAVRGLILGIFAGQPVDGVEQERSALQRIEAEMKAVNFDPNAALERFRPYLERIRAALLPQFRQLADDQRTALNEALKTTSRKLKDTGAPEDFDTTIATACVNFGLIDVAIFPMMDSAGVEDLILIDTLRISPRDSTMWVRREALKSAGMGAFAGFFDRDAREYDLAIGRLDGAERLIDLILTAAFGHPSQRPDLRAKYRRKLADAILAEAIGPDAPRRVSPKVAKELQRLQLLPPPHVAAPGG